MENPPKNGSEHEKIRLEHEAAKIFMRLFRAQTGETIKDIWHNKPQRPDVSCWYQNERLDLEIAHLYGSEIEAMDILGRDLTPETLEELHEQALYSDLDSRLLCALNRILEKKANKTYQSHKTWLVIRNAHPGWECQTIQQLRQQIIVPERHVFEQIWIVGDMKGESGILKLFP